jgi:hypothetical protein
MHDVPPIDKKSVLMEVTMKSLIGLSASVGLGPSP